MVVKVPAETAIFYPETDGMPLPDGETQAPQYRRAVGRLEAYFNRKKDRRARVNGNTMLYYSEGDPQTFVSPDCYVVFDLSDEALRSLSIQGRNTYLLWEVDKPPEFVLEIGSRSTANRDMNFKRGLYADIGSSEYWLHDPTGGEFYHEPLIAYRLADGEYQRIPLNYESDGSVWGRSEALNLEVWWIEGELQFRDPEDGKWLLSHEEEAARADFEAARADSAEARLAELEEQLRRLNGTSRGW